jgi:hypothetical protein
MTIDLPLCYSCARARKLGSAEGEPYTCEAYPAGIPFEIIYWQHDHHAPFKGDNGMLYLEKAPVIRETRNGWRR